MGRRLLGVLLASVLALAVAPQACLACSCVAPQSQQAFSQAALVFQGRLLRVGIGMAVAYQSDGTVEERLIYRADFLVKTVWKGEVLPILSLYDGWGGLESTCDLRLHENTWAIGQDFLVFARYGNSTPGSPNWPVTSNCSGTQILEGSDKLVMTLGPGKAIAEPLYRAPGLGGEVASSATQLALTADFARRQNQPSVAP